MLTSLQISKRCYSPGAVCEDLDYMLTLVQAKQRHAGVPVATHLFPPPSLWLYPKKDLLFFTGHFLLSQPTPCFFRFTSLAFLSLVIDSILSRTKETLALTEQQRWQLSSYGFKIALHLFSNKTLCASCVRISFFHPHLILCCIFGTNFFQFLLCFSFLFSLLVWLLSLFLEILSGACLISYTISHCLCVSLPPFLCCFLFLVYVCGFPGLHGQSPCSGLSVSWLTEGSQNLLCKQETISKLLAGWLWTVETSLHISLSQARSTGLPINHISG